MDIRLNRRKARKGFTLIELLVVILIIAILAALIVPKVIGKTGDAKKAAAQSDLKTLSDAIQQFRLNCDRYPTTSEGLDVLQNKPSDASGWKGPYLTKPIPNDPWHNPYHYETPGPNGADFIVESYGADGVAGGDAGSENEDIIETG